MENIFSYPFLLIVFIIIVVMKFLVQRKGRSLNLPPSPPGSLPIIGHLHLFEQPFHKTMQTLSQKYGPIISLKYGTRLAIVVSSPSVVEECFLKNDIIFANRPPFLMGKHLGYNYNSMVTASYGDHWRNLRKISALELLSHNRLSMSVGIRKDEIKHMVSKLVLESLRVGGGYAKVELKSLIRVLTLNMLLRNLVGIRYNGSEEAKQFIDIMSETVELFLALDPADILPVLRWIDYGYSKRNKKLATKTDTFLQGLIDDEHKREVPALNTEDQDKQPLITRLLTLQKSDPEIYTDETIKSLIFLLLVAGTDTTSTTIFCAMSELLNNPKVMDKVRTEMEIQVGQDELVNELDLPRIPHLQNIFLETLRMYPPAPLLVPHMSSQECKISGYDVPSGTILLVNAWAIHRDPYLWDEPTEFKPDRFQTTNENVNNVNVEPYKLLPFGAGRRACPGANMSKQMVGLVLASLIQCFDWKKVSDDDYIDKNDKKFNISEAESLEAMFKPRPIITKILSSP